MKLAYNTRHDALFNVETLEWIESKCTSKNCKYCSTRPPTAKNALIAWTINRIPPYVKKLILTKHYTTDYYKWRQRKTSWSKNT